MWEKGQITWNEIASNCIAGHSEYALPKGRKIDINGYTMSNMRSQIAALIPGFKKRVNRKAIKVGTAPVFDRDTYKFIDGVQAPTPTTQRESWFDMATRKDLIDAINEVNIPQRIMDSQIPVQRSGRSQFRRLGTLIQGQDAAHNRFVADLAALKEITNQLAAGTGTTIDYMKVEEAAARGVARAIEAADQGG